MNEKMSRDAKRRQMAYQTGRRDAVDDLREWLIPQIPDKNTKEQLNRKLDEIAKK